MLHITLLYPGAVPSGYDVRFGELECEEYIHMYIHTLGSTGLEGVRAPSEAYLSSLFHLSLF